MVVRMIALLLALATLSAAAPPPSRDAPAFGADIAPVLAQHCVRCHNSTDPNGGLRLDSYERLIRGGDTGPSVKPGDAQNSLLIQKVEHRDRPVMPPRKWLPKATISMLRAWIDAGASR